MLAIKNKAINENYSETLKKHIVPYEERLVAFFDLQGFKNKIIEEYTSEAIGSVFATFLNITDMLKNDYSDMCVTIISDSIVISTKVDNPKHILSFLEACSHFAIPKIGNTYIAIRGGIAYGKLHHKDNIVYGPALIEAYHLCETLPEPRYLRTTLTKKTFDLIVSKSDEFTKNVIYKTIFPTDNTKVYYLFNPWLVHFAITENSDANFDGDEIVKRLKEYIYWIAMCLAENTDKHKLYEKYQDLAVQTIITFLQIKDNYSDSLSNDSLKTVELYSNAEVALEIISKMEKQFIENKNY